MLGLIVFLLKPCLFLVNLVGVWICYTLLMVLLGVYAKPKPKGKRPHV